MRILGNTPDGDLIIQVSQAEWDGLQDGIRPKDATVSFFEQWNESAAHKLLGKSFHGQLAIYRAFKYNEIDGSIQSLRDIADDRVRIDGIGPGIRANLRKLLDEQPDA